MINRVFRQPDPPGGFAEPLRLYISKMIDQAVKERPELLTKKLVLPVLITFPIDKEFHEAPLETIRVNVFKNHSEIEQAKRQAMLDKRKYIQLEVTGQRKKDT